MIEETLAEEGIKYRDRLFSPLVTLWAFLSQVIDTNKTCHNAVSRVIAWLAGQGEEIPSEDHSAYCQARISAGKFCEEIIQQKLPKFRKRSSIRTIMVWTT